MRLEIGLLRQNEINPGEANQNAADHHRAIAQASDRYAGGVDCSRVLADGTQTQSEASAVERPIGERHQQERDVGHDVVARNEVLIDRADDRHGADLVGERPVDDAELSRRRELRRSAALRPDRVADERGQSVGHHVDRGAGHDLVGALIDRGVAVDEREHDGGCDTGEEPEPYASGKGRRRGGSERPDQNLALKPDVDDTRAFRPKAGKAGENERDSETHAGSENDDEGVEPFHAAARQMGGCVVRRASRVATGRRNMCSSAPANSTTSPWITTIMSRLILGMSIESAWPP